MMVDEIDGDCAFENYSAGWFAIPCRGWRRRFSKIGIRGRDG
jgi:hypothetical protein